MSTLHMGLRPSTAQFVRKRLPSREKVGYPASSHTGLRNNQRTQDQASGSEQAISDGETLDHGSVPFHQDLYDPLFHDINISSLRPKGLHKLKLIASQKDRKARCYSHSLWPDGNWWLSNQSSRQRLLSGSIHHIPRVSFYHEPFTNSISPFPPARRCSGKKFSTSAASSASLENQHTMFNRNDQLPFKPQQIGAEEPNIRERLRLWESQYRAQQNSDFHNEIPSSMIALARHDRVEVFDEGAESDIEEISYPVYEKGDVLDIDSQKPYLLCGDLVELRASNYFKIELAIFVRAIGSQYQYYTMSGKWIHQNSRLAKYCVPGFVDAKEVEPLLAFLPSKYMPEALQNKLQDFEHALPRDVGSPLIKKMLNFWKISDIFYRDAALNLNDAHKRVAHRFDMRYASLSDLAHELLPESYCEDGRFPAQALYALHRSLMLDDLGFRPQKWNHRMTNQFEIIPVREIELARTIGNDIRNYQEHLILLMQGFRRGKSTPIIHLLEFLRKARHKIQESRRTRKYTQHGMIGPAGRGVGNDESGGTANIPKDVKICFNTSDWHYISFIGSWAALRTVPNQSYLHGTASAILRATGMYDDTTLDQRVGWTFLQEVGVIAPWENRIHFDMRLPSAMAQIKPPGEWPNTNGTEQLNTGLDVFDGLRKDWGNLPVYCIDDISASEIDDGVSIEPADAADEYWIHVHVADPASMIQPRSDIARNAMTAVRTKYLPDRVISMLPGDVVQEHLSLAPGRRCLTFSGRIDINGNLLSTKITPGVLHNIIYMTPTTLSKVTGESPSVHETALVVGDNVVTSPIEICRQVMESHEMTELDERNLKLLHTLGKARQSISLAKGAVMFDSSYFQITVATSGGLIEDKKEPDYTEHAWDPRIELKVEKRHSDENKTYENTVMNLMLLAGEVGARWCQERGIPVINRVSYPHPDDLDPREYFRRVITPLINHSEKTHVETQDFTGKVKEDIDSSGESIISLKSNDVEATNLSKIIPIDIALEYQRLLGAVAPSTTPGPHLHLGLDMFTRTTSPLRRYSDLLVHWQIEAALLEEARLGQSLIGSTRDDYLPFKKNELDSFIPFLDGKERELNSYQRDAQRSWAMQLLLRAWKFNQAPLPATFEFWTRTFEDKTITGGLTCFGGISATFKLPDWLREGDIRVGDVFEVKLADLDIYNRRIEVEPVRRIKRTAERVM